MNLVVVIIYIIIAVCAYLLGSVSTAVIVSKTTKKQDVRDYGSHNAGMTNTLRVYGKLAALYTSIGDLCKGIVAVVLARLLLWLFCGSSFDTDVSEIGACIAAVFAIAGHVFPCFFQFKGGKGILTSLGVFLFIEWKAALICFAVFIIVVAVTRYVSLGSIIALGIVPFVTYGVRVLSGANPLYVTICAALLGVSAVFMHRANIKRLLNGTENKIGQKNKS